MILANLWKPKNHIIWVKNNWTAGDLKAQYGQQYELIYYLNKGRRAFNIKRFPDVWNFNRIAGKKQVHQNQKPLDLISRMVLNSTNEGDIILDPFMGSGSVGVVCKQLNRGYVGIEIEKDYYNISVKRINAEKCILN